MLRLGLIVSVVLLAACKGAPGQSMAERDSRFDLSRYNMAPILVEDIKKCQMAMRVGALGKSQIPEDLQEAFQFSADVWQNIVLDMKTYGDGAKALVDGEFVKESPGDLKTIFAKGDNLTARSHKCGTVAGKLIVAVGMLSTRESVEIAEATNPGIFDGMGVSKADLEALFAKVDGRVAGLADVEKDQLLSCVAVSQAKALNDTGAAKEAEVWVQVLNARLADADAATSGFAEKNTYWRSFAKFGNGRIEQLDDYETTSAACQAHTRKVMEG